MEPVPVISKGNCNIPVLRDILSRYWKKEVEIVNADTEPATAIGINFTSDVWRVRFKYSENENKEKKAPLEDVVIVKSKSENENKNKLMHTDVAFKNEILAYEKVIPTLSRYVHSGLRVPGYIHGDSSSIVLEDMCVKSFVGMSKKLASEWNHIWSALQEMAKLHAASIIMQKENKKEFDALVKEITTVSLKDSRPLAVKQATCVDTILYTLEGLNTPEAAKYIEVVRPLQKDAWEAQKKIIEEERPIRVISHGSVWINNLLYRNDMITLLDWQHIVYSSPATDLTYFLYVALDADFLLNKHKKVLQFYIMSLHQVLYDTCSNRWSAVEIQELLKQLDFNWIDAEVRRCSLYGYMMAQWITPLYYWSEAVFRELELLGGLENLSVEKRLEYMTSDQKDRVIKLTKFYLQESSRM